MTKIIVYHAAYGCDTGCCGHYVEVTEGEHPKRLDGPFDFDHPWSEDDFRTFAEEQVRRVFGEEHVKDLDWENCEVSNSC